MYFIFLTILLLTLVCIGGYHVKVRKVEFMSYEFSTVVKGFAILTVIWAHSGARLHIGGIQFVAGIGVALFLICSGYGLEKSFYKNGLNAFFRKRLMRICIPYWIVITLGAIFLMRWSMKFYIEKMLFIQAGWYIKYIFVCYFIFYALKKLKTNHNWSEKTESIVLFMIYVMWFVADSLFFANPDIPFLVARQMLCFPMGICMAKNGFVKMKILNYKTVIISGGIGVIFMAINQLPYVNSLPNLMSNLLSLLTVFPLAIAVLVMFDKISWLANNRFFIFSGVISYELFLVHGCAENLIVQSVSSICVCLGATYGVAYCVHRVVLNGRAKKNDRSDRCHINKK